MLPAFPFGKDADPLKLPHYLFRLFVFKAEIFLYFLHTDALFLHRIAADFLNQPVKSFSHPCRFLSVEAVVSLFLLFQERQHLIHLLFVPVFQVIVKRGKPAGFQFLYHHVYPWDCLRVENDLAHTVLFVDVGQDGI